MTEHIGLQEALDIIYGSKGDPMVLMNDPRLNQFIDDVQNASVDVLKDKDGEYLSGSTDFIKSCVIAFMVTQVDSSEDLLKVLGWINSKSMDMIIAVAFKMSVGLAVIEELH